MDRDSRRLSHSKGSRISTQTSVPLSSDGDDGDQVMVGSTLYTKSQGRWMPFKSGGGNVNDGWHGSQKYVKILPSHFIEDNNAEGDIRFPDSVDPATDYIANGIYTGSTSGSLGVGLKSSAPDSGKGVGAFIALPLGYWAIAFKIYCSHNIVAGAAAERIDGGSTSGTHKATAGIMAYGGDLTTGKAVTLLDSIGTTNTRIVLDTALLSQEQSYLHIYINDFALNCLVYGGYVELRRVKTAVAIAEEESSTGGDVLERGG